MLVLLHVSGLPESKRGIMAKVVIVAVVLLSLLGCVASPCTRITVHSAEMEQLLQSTMLASRIDVHSSSACTIRIPNAEYLPASSTISTRWRYRSVTVAPNYAMFDVSHSTATDAAELACICDTLSMACNAGTNSCPLLSPSDTRFRAGGELSTKELLVIAGVERVCLVWADHKIPPPTTSVRKYLYAKVVSVRACVFPSKHVHDSIYILPNESFNCYTCKLKGTACL